jgi:hypothetical protein
MDPHQLSHVLSNILPEPQQLRDYEPPSLAEEMALADDHVTDSLQPLIVELYERGDALDMAKMDRLVQAVEEGRLPGVEDVEDLEAFLYDPDGFRLDEAVALLDAEESALDPEGQMPEEPMEHQPIPEEALSEEGWVPKLRPEVKPGDPRLPFEELPSLQQEWHEDSVVEQLKVRSRGEGNKLN